MNHISSPRHFERKRTVVRRKSISVLLRAGIFFIALCLWIVSQSREQSLALVSSPDNANKIGSPKSFVRHSSDRGKKALKNSGTTISDSFDWSHLQVSQDVKGKCGADKCFWRSNSDPDSVGYLVASADYHYKRMKQAYKFAVNILDEKCKAKHLFLEAPQLVKIDPDWAKKLNSLRHNDQNEFAYRKGRQKKRGDVFHEDDHYVVVQKVKVAPKPNLMFGFMAKKWEMLVEKDIPRFRKELQSKGISLREIEEKLESERKGIECAMEYSETYWYDLQGLIDVDGNYFHIDVDSQFWAEIGDPEDPVHSSVKTVTKAMAYQRRQNLIGRFNEMIQRLVYPPPDGVEELSAWKKNEGPNRRKSHVSSDEAE